MENKNIGQPFDAFLESEGILDGCERVAKRRVRRWRYGQRKKRVARILARWRNCDESEISEVTLGIHADTFTTCSRLCCGNPRHFRGKHGPVMTVQERRQDETE